MRPRRARLNHTDHLVLAQLRRNAHMSYDNLAAALPADRGTVITAICRLEAEKRVIRIRGRGHVPNRYILTDRLIDWR